MHDDLVHERELLLRKRKRLLAKMDTTAGVERALINNEQLIPVCLRINELTDQINAIRNNLRGTN